MKTGEEAIARLRDPEARVSSHYVVEEDGRVFRLVPEARRAWHAGVAFWRGERNVNAASIGVEIVNPGHEWGYRAFPEPQVAAVIALVADIRTRWMIEDRDIVGHSDVAPSRKEDPGELFPWGLLARHRLALATPDSELIDPQWNDGAFYLALERFGYDVADGIAATRAFQRRFRPARLDGEIDGELRAILFALLLDRDQGRAR